MSTITEIFDSALGITRRKSDVNMRTRLVSAVDRAVKHWAKRRPWNALKRWEDFTANGTRFLVLPRRVRQVLSVSDVDNKQPVRGGSDWHLNSSITWLGGQTDVTPWSFRELGAVPVISNPETVARLEIEASVSEALTIAIAGLARDTTASGTSLELYETVERYVVAGTGSSITSTFFAQVDSIEKSVLDGSARITIRDNATGKPISVLNPDESCPEYTRIEFLHVPPAGRQIRIEFYTEPERIVSESSVLPTSVDLDYLVWRLVGDIHWMDNEPQQAQVAWAKSDGLMQEAQVAEKSQGDHMHIVSPRAGIYRRFEGEDLY